MINHPDLYFFRWKIIIFIPLNCVQINRKKNLYQNSLPANPFLFDGASCSVNTGPPVGLLPSWGVCVAVLHLDALGTVACYEN